MYIVATRTMTSVKKKCHSHKAKFELRTYMYNQGVFIDTQQRVTGNYVGGEGGVLKVREVRSTPFIADTVETSSKCPPQPESVIAGVYFSQTSVNYLGIWLLSVLSGCPLKGGEHKTRADCTLYLCRDFIKVLNQRRTGFDTQAKNWQGQWENFEIL